MSKLLWTPWHQVVQLRDDLKSGELSLSIFAADIYDVVMQKARPVYQDPKEFFALTYPTFNLRELAKDVVLRLAGKSEKAIRQLELTYGGGKTHTLITLLHLVSNPASLPDLPAVREFTQHIGITLPQARVAVLAFDKLDVEKGMEISDPKGTFRWLKQPWSVLAWQLAGSEGLKLLHAEGKDEERDSAPAENLMSELLTMPEKEGLATLILLDEVLMYAREKVGMDRAWLGRLENFFQYLTQASVKANRCAIVASLLASKIEKNDQLGREINAALYNIFRREGEENVQPVVKEDVAEVLRRRFFTTESIKDSASFRSHVVAALKGISELDEQTKKDGNVAEEKFLKSYPFHPDLTEIFYSKWTNLEGFQRTRGVLRTFALALRSAESWDQSPLVSTNVFLSQSDNNDISEGLRELASIAAAEEYEGKRHEWTAILAGELAKAREIQSEITGLKLREVEQAVVATFLHSQPIGQKALLRDLLILLGHTRPDKISLEKALQRWTELSWFLDEGAISEVEGDNGRKGLPKFWRLGSKPNLRQMHNDKCKSISSERIEIKLNESITNLKNLSAGASGAGAKVHTLPNKPSDIEDDGLFHYAILGPKAASSAGFPSAEAKKFIEEKKSGENRATNRNAIVLAVPSREGLDVVQDRIRKYLGWEEVQFMLKGQELDLIRASLLKTYIENSKKEIPEKLQQAYCVVVTLSEKNEVQAFKINVDDKESLFTTIKKDSRSRIQDTEISAEALLPDGPYNLWRSGETSRRVKDLVGAFAQQPQLPKMLRQKEILSTLVVGAKEGFFALRVMRPDRSFRTIWRQDTPETDSKDASLEVILPEAAEITELSPNLLLPGELPELWPSSLEITLKELVDYFSGNKVVKVQKEGYEELVPIPKANWSVIEAAVKIAVESGKLWLVADAASILSETIPDGLLTNSALLMPPPSSFAIQDILPEKLPEAWQEQQTTAFSIYSALSNKRNKNLPWVTVSKVIDDTFRARSIEKAIDSSQWPCEFSNAKTVKLRTPDFNIKGEQISNNPIPLPTPSLPVKKGVRVGKAELSIKNVQDLADVISEVAKIAAGYGLKCQVAIEVGHENLPTEEVIEQINQILKDISKDLKLC